MAHGQPDFWTATTPAMPTIGEGQVAWFQSEAALVGGEGDEDLINYVVPDDMELHVCSGIISCSFPVIQRYKLITTPATWVSPTSHIDPDNEWYMEFWAYDGRLSTRAHTIWGDADWSSYLILLINEQYINKVKFYAEDARGWTDKIDIDVWYEGDWHDAYEGVFAYLEWVEKSIPAGTKLVSKARVRFHRGDPAYVPDIYLYEFMLNTSGETPQEGIYFDTHAIIPYLPQAPYLVPAGATFAIRVYNDDDAAHNMAVSLAGYLQSKV